ncbi:MAG TPA: hypothetical protein VJ904_11120 [Tichowtungia sp.]|nr:hypothetical protein [Tichowtungia sp.]
MNRTGRITKPLLALGLAGVLFLAFRESGEPVGQEEPVVLKGGEQSVEKPGRDRSESKEKVPAVVPESSNNVERPVTLDKPVADFSAASEDSPSASRVSTNELMAVLPLWMQEEAEVDAYADERMVAGVPVTRIRGRYTWPNGSRMEVEISDLGEAPSELLLRSLGYNTTASNTVTEAGFSVQVDGAEDPTRFEYDYDTGEGSMQILAADRFLVEVQLGLLLPESFDAVIDHQVPIAVLEKMADQQNTP